MLDPSHFFSNKHLLTSTSLEIRAPPTYSLYKTTTATTSLNSLSLKQTEISTYQLGKEQIDHLSYLQPMTYSDKTPHLEFSLINQD